MNRNQLVQALVASTQVTPNNVRACLDGLLGTRDSVGVLVDGLCEDGKVQLAGFGTFEIRERAARTGHNPRTGERVHIAASRTAAFRPSISFRQRLQSGSSSRQAATENPPGPVEPGTPDVARS